MKTQEEIAIEYLAKTLSQALSINELKKHITYDSQYEIYTIDININNEYCKRKIDTHIEELDNQFKEKLNNIMDNKIIIIWDDFKINKNKEK